MKISFNLIVFVAVLINGCSTVTKKPELDFVKEKGYCLSGTEIPFSGTSVTYYSSGKKKAENSYINGKIQGEFKSWYANGHIEEEGICYGNKYEGKLTTWYDNGQKESERFYDKGFPIGVHKRWYKNGRLMQIEKFDNAGKSIEYIHWYPQGDKAWHVYCQNNKFDGLAKEWYDNGNKKRFENYDKGIKNGESSIWDKSGKIIAKGIYKNGQPWDGTFEIFPPNTIAEIGKGKVKKYKNGKEIFTSEIK